MTQYKSEIKKLQNLVSDSVWEILKECNAIIAGGAITSVFCNREVNDVDVYLRNEDDFALFIDLVFEGDFCLIANNLTNRSVLFRDKETGQHVQLIVYKFFQDIPSLFKDYDFTCNMGALEFVENDQGEKQPNLVLHEKFMKHNSQRYLEFNEGTAYPLISALRVQKYVDKGYMCPKAQFLRILLAVNKKNIDSWEKLKDEIGGMYGLNMDEIFNEKEEFSLESALDTLNEIESDNAFVTFDKTITKDMILDQIALKGCDTSSRISCEGKNFKWVHENEDGTLESIYRGEFKYVVGETVNGGKNGIYFSSGWDILTSCYAGEGGIIELEGGHATKLHGYSWEDTTLKGDVKVVDKYSRIEFIRKYTK